MTSETCADCEMDAWNCKCDKFKPQNHSPQGHKVGSATGNPTEFKDTESEEIKTETQVVNDRLNSSGSDDEFKDIRWKDESLSDKITDTTEWDRGDCETKIVLVEDVKESVKQVKEYKTERYGNSVIIISVKTFDKIFGKELNGSALI